MVPAMSGTSPASSLTLCQTKHMGINGTEKSTKDLHFYFTVSRRLLNYPLNFLNVTACLLDKRRFYSIDTATYIYKNAVSNAAFSVSISFYTKTQCVSKKTLKGNSYRKI